MSATTVFWSLVVVVLLLIVGVGLLLLWSMRSAREWRDAVAGDVGDDERVRTSGPQRTEQAPTQ